MNKIKVLYFIIDMGDGGAQSIVFNYIQKLAYDSNYEVELIVLKNKINYRYQSYFNSNSKVKVITLDLYKNKMITYFQKNIYKNKINEKIESLINDFNPNIIHIHLCSTLLLLSDVISEKCMTIPCFYTLHSNPKRFNDNTKIIISGLFKKGVIPICLNQNQVDLALEAYGSYNYNIIHNGINYNEITNNIISKKEARKKFKINNNEFVISAVGRMEPIKNYNFLIDIFHELINTRQDINFHLFFAGDGSQKKDLINKAKKLGLSSKITFLGNINNCTELYCASDTFVMTSISEASPLVLIEAQLCNTYSVVSNGIPSESIITCFVKKMEMDSSMDDWCNSILIHDKGKCFLPFDTYNLDSIIISLKKLYVEHIDNNY